MINLDNQNQTQIIGVSGGYRRTFSFGFVNLIYHATTAFCRKNYDYKNDSLGKTVGQMVGAARSARQNIVEGSMRSGTSKETELRLLDVARGSLQELAGDYEAFMIDENKQIWASEDPRAIKVKELKLDRFETGGINVRHDYAAYIFQMIERFSSWIMNDDPIVAANSILLLIDQACALLVKQMQTVSDVFCEEGGFTERMSKARYQVKDAKQIAKGAPNCPKCGKPMRKMMAKKGRNAGNPFWGCTGYPDCQMTLPWR